MKHSDFVLSSQHLSQMPPKCTNLHHNFSKFSVRGDISLTLSPLATLQPACLCKNQAKPPEYHLKNQKKPA